MQFVAAPDVIKNFHHKERNQQHSQDGNFVGRGHCPPKERTTSPPEQGKNPALNQGRSGRAYV
jgi:hypothetical protein